jgi:methylmalonyl-CoA mutase N-terminal domain/subunit
VPVTTVDPRIEAEQVERLRAMRARRDREGKATHAAALEKVERAARGSDNVLPCILEAVKAYATVGEIAGVLRSVWGEHVETLVI